MSAVACVGSWGDPSMARAFIHSSRPPGRHEHSPSQGRNPRPREVQLFTKRQGQDQAQVGPPPSLSASQLAISPSHVLSLVFQVTMPGEPMDMACGVDHMVTLAKSFI